MKKALSFTLLLFSWTIIHAQVRPEAYLSKLPSAPGVLCSEEIQGKEDFFAKVNEIGEQLQTELSRRQENRDAYVEANEPKMQANAMKQTGISPDLIQKLQSLEKQSKGATGDQQKAYEAQKKALADQIIQQKMNISMGEIENLKKMDKAGKTAWSTAYISEKNAEVMADPKKYKEQNAKEMQKYNLLNKQKQLDDSLKAQQERYMKKFAEIDEDESGKKLLAKIEGIRKEIYDLYTETAKHETTPDRQKLIALRSEMRKAKISYCNLLSPKYVQVLAEYKSFIQSSMSAYYRFENLTNEVVKSRGGADLNPEPGEFGLGNVSGYIKRLLDAYKYNLLGPEDYTIG